MDHLYACIVAREFPLQAILRLRPELQQVPVAVLDGEAPNEQVFSMSDRARALGVVDGMSRVEVNMFAGVTVLPRSPLQEAAAQAALLACTACYSPLVEDKSNSTCFICIADITGTETLFGPPDVVAERLRTHALDLRVQAVIAVSRNFDASVCLALDKLTFRRSGIRVVPPGLEADALSTLPLSVLPLSQEQADTFSMWGIRSLGDLAKIKEAELITRMGQEGKRLRMMARGEAPHLFHAIEPGFLLEEQIQLDSPVELLNSLLFIVGVMLDQLIVRVQTRVLALASITLELGLEDNSLHTRTVRPALPTIDRQLWLKLIHLDLQAHPPRDGIRALLLKGQPGSTSKVQLGLFSPQVPEPTRLDVTLARIRNLVGDGYVGSATLADTHRPDSFRMESFQVHWGVSHSPENGTEPAAQRMAMRQLRPAESAHVNLRAQQPESFVFRGKLYTVEKAYGPWSSSGDWWKPTLWSKEQWDIVARAQDHAATWLCCCLVRDLAEERWQVEALYD